MTEYIEREAALTEFGKVCNICMALVARPTCGECSVADTVRKVKRIPAADVRPVVRGKWEEKSMWYVCSACGEHVEDEIYHMLDPNMLPNFCPYCGADMRKEADNG